VVGGFSPSTSITGLPREHDDVLGLVAQHLAAADLVLAPGQHGDRHAAATLKPSAAIT
jgi:hypothetical protein